MTLPSRRVITLRAMTADDGPIEHSLDAGANPVRSLGLCGPDWLDDPQHRGSVDHGQRQVTQNGKGIATQR